MKRFAIPRRMLRIFLAGLWGTLLLAEPVSFDVASVKARPAVVGIPAGRCHHSQSSSKASACHDSRTREFIPPGIIGPCRSLP